MPSGGGEEAVAPRVPPVPAKPTQTEQDEHYATFRAAPRSWCCLSGTRRIPSDDFGVQVQTHGVPGCDAGAGEGHECPCSSLLYCMAARFGMETFFVEVRP